MASSELSALQREIAERFFDEPSEFFLTGGAALAGFHLGHRPTADLDLFAPPSQSMDEGVRILRRAAAAAGADVQALHESPDFRRFALSRDAETTLVDLVIDRAPQLEPEKLRAGRVRLDSPREIAANKICALLVRTEPRDLADLEALLARGATLEATIADAQKKDGAADAATLAWVLERYRIAETAPLPPGTSRDSLERFRGSLVDALLRLAAPREP